MTKQSSPFLGSNKPPSHPVACTRIVDPHPAFGLDSRLSGIGVADSPRAAGSRNQLSQDFAFASAILRSTARPQGRELLLQHLKSLNALTDPGQPSERR